MLLFCFFFHFYMILTSAPCSGQLFLSSRASCWTQNVCKSSLSLKSHLKCDCLLVCAELKWKLSATIKQVMTGFPEKHSRKILPPYIAFYLYCLSNGHVLTLFLYYLLMILFIYPSWSPLRNPPTPFNLLFAFMRVLSHPSTHSSLPALAFPYTVASNPHRARGYSSHWCPARLWLGWTTVFL